MERTALLPEGRTRFPALSSLQSRLPSRAHGPSSIFKASGVEPSHRSLLLAVRHLFSDSDLTALFSGSLRLHRAHPQNTGAVTPSRLQSLFGHGR